MAHLKNNVQTQILPVLVEELYDGDLLLAGARVHEHW